jgi:23S rRNA pseudouridine1911/1915/1917 synthase
MAERRRESSDEESDGNELSTGFAEIFEVEQNYAGWRLDLYLGQKLKRASRTQIVRYIRNGGHFADGRAARPASRVRAGDVVVLPRQERSDPETPPPSDTRVLYRDEQIVVLDKPAGLLVHRTASEATRTVAGFLRDEFGDTRVEPVHRLDRDTSGCLVCAIGEATIITLRTMFAQLEVKKDYAAVVRDPDNLWMPGVERTFDTPLGFATESPVGIRVGPGDWTCSTTATCVARQGGSALLRVNITQGRQHQIRAHLAIFGTPLVGDKLYAMGDAFFLEWIDAPGSPALVAQLDARWHALHAWRVRFALGGRDYDVEARLPARLGF